MNATETSLARPLAAPYTDGLRDGVLRQWHMEDLQSFTPTRFMPPQLTGYQGRAVVIDPDVTEIRTGEEVKVSFLAQRG